MKKAIIIPIILLSHSTLPTHAQTGASTTAQTSANTFKYETAHWFTNYEDALKEVNRFKPHMLIYFSGSDWCSNCVRFEKSIFSTNHFTTQFAAKLVLMNADFPRTRKKQLTPAQLAQNESLAERYNPEGHFPKVVLVNAAGKSIYEWNGYPTNGPEAFWGQLGKLIQ